MITAKGISSKESTSIWAGQARCLFRVRPETINKRIRGIRQLLDQAGYTIQPGPYRLASLDDLPMLAAAEGITIAPKIKTAC